MSVACAVRAAGPADAEAIAEALEEASGGLMSQLLGARWRAVLIEVVRIPGHEMSLERARVATVADEPVGVAVSCAAGTPTVDRALEQAAGRSLIRMAFFSALARPVLRFMSRHEPGDWHLTAAAVDESLRGEGIGSVLLADTRQRAIKHGSTAVTLDVDVANDGARRLYERLGFVETARSGRAWLLGGAQVARMSLAVA